MSSVVKPDESYGRRFFANTYRVISRQLKIDPITEGRTLKRKINELYYSDMMALQDSAERERRVALANKWSAAYGKRLQKFFTVFQRYCFLRGEIRAVRAMEEFLKDADPELERLDKLLKKQRGVA
jgi:hypothetical protein